MSCIGRQNLRYKVHDPFQCFIFYSLKFGESPLLSRRSKNSLYNNVITEKHPAGFMQRMIYRREQHTEHPLEMTNRLYLSWVDLSGLCIQNRGDLFIYTLGSSTADWFCTGPSAQLSPTGLLHLCQWRADFRPSHQIINKAKTFSFGHGK